MSKPVNSVFFVTLFVGLFALSMLLLTACQQQQIKKDIEVKDAWLRAMPEGSRSTAGFMTIINNTNKPLIFKDVEVSWARHAMLHESKVVDGMAKMLHLDDLTIEDQMSFEPGAKHIMIMGVREPLMLGKSYNILLHFEGLEPLEINFEVRHAN
ncbi:MAG: copper chaperone PCu(A)C [Kangiellaceae bacterium]|nr:copper chaperone PCu(A)C [Kangiellaceae bacterium]